MTIIFDLDYTLLNTERFKEDLAKALGISWSVFNESYQRYIRSGWTKDYQIDDHIEFLIESGRVKNKDKKEVKQNVLNFLSRIDNYLFKEVEEVLSTLKEKNHKLILATFGNPEWQRLKIDNLSIKKYFDKIVITNKDKGPLLNFLRSSKDGMVIVNDNASETVLMKEKLPKAEIILIKGPYSENCAHNLGEHELKDCLELIK